MGKRRGKFSKQNHLRSSMVAGFTIPKHEYQRPHKNEWEPEETFTVALSSESRLHVRTNLYRGAVIDFSITHQFGGPIYWKNLFRVDTAHGTVHRHDFLKGENSITHIEDIVNNEVVNEQYAEQYDYMLSTVEEREILWKRMKQI